MHGKVLQREITDDHGGADGVAAGAPGGSPAASAAAALVALPARPHNAPPPLLGLLPSPFRTQYRRHCLSLIICLSFFLVLLSSS